MSIKKYSDANGLSRFWSNVKNIIPTQNDIINLIKTTILDVYYPVGSYYETSDVDFNPNSQWGGTWVLEAEGQFHISAGATTKYNIGQTGGSPDAVVPSHNHTASGGAVVDKEGFNTNKSGAVTSGITGGSHRHESYINYAEGTESGWAYQQVNTKRIASTARNLAETHTHNLPSHTHSLPAHGHGFTQPTISTEGVSVTDKNLPPFIAVNRWHRTA